MSEAPRFSPRIVAALAVGAAAMFALSAVLTSRIRDEDGSYRATRASPSAIGHAGFFELLRRLDMPVAATRGEVAPGSEGLIVVQEPRTALNTSAKQLDVEVGPDVLVILPKRWGERDHRHAGWVSTSGLLGLSEVQGILSLLDRNARVTRRPSLPRLSARGITVLPRIEGDVQLVTGRDLTPIIGDATGMLLAELATPQDQHVYVLADPDPLENHGIVDPPNARFAVALVRALWSGRGSIVFDETVHAGLLAKRNPLELLFAFPYSIVGAQGLVAVALLLLATTARFGGTLGAPPPLGTGKSRLIANIAALMERGGHQVVILRRYIGLELKDAGRALHAPTGLGDSELAAWLDRVAGARGLVPMAQTMHERSVAEARSRDRQRLLADAAAVHRWKKGLLDDENRCPDRR